MITLLQSIVDTIISLVSFVIHSIESLLNLFVKIPTFISIFVSSVSQMPTVIIPFATITITMSIVLFVVGRSK